jgi:hypothetical protein
MFFFSVLPFFSRAVSVIIDTEKPMTKDKKRKKEEIKKM